MKATPFSEKQYYPMMLSNGSNAVLIDYAGSMFPSRNNHSHFEQHQGTPCGWYKVSHSWKTPSLWVIQSVVACGYQVIMNGEICEPKHYCQEFDARQAVLTTKITSFGGVELEIESFLNDDNILVEHYKFVAVPREHNVDFALLLFIPDSMVTALGLRNEPFFEIDDSAKLDSTGFSYKICGIEGQGAMYSDIPADSRENAAGHLTKLIFKNIKSGRIITRFLTVADSSETKDFTDDVKHKMATCGKDGFKKVKERHAAVWKNYFGASDVSLPDKEFEDIYNLSRYMMRASLHPGTGGLTVGILPHLWAGGTYVPYDAGYLHQAMLLTNNIETAARHLDYYAMQYEKALKTATEIGASGAAFSGWTTCLGEHKGANIKDHLVHKKPCMAGFIAAMFYWQWKYSGTLSDEKKNILKDVLEFVERFIVYKGEWAEIAPCMAGNESAVDVSNDSFTSMTFARVFKGASEIFPESGYRNISEKLYAGLAKNYKDGLLQPFPGAWYRTGFQIWAYLFNLPDGIAAENVYKALEFCRTPWGYDSEQPSEVYRDWPWISSRAAICTAHMKDSRKAFELLMHQKKYTSSLGAIPEKIRLDGFPIGYWYASPHGLFIWAAAAALANTGAEGDLRLLWGMDGSWKEISFRDLRLPGGIIVSASVSAGKLKVLAVTNTGKSKKGIRLDINPLYMPAGIPSEIFIGPGSSFRWRNDNVES
ncbi:MAG: hypothetical protein Q7J98_02855 [Kiritimatiellia bacterium]|nr:hypothetical protein [Kiritimatiellia bacterium]